MACPFLLLSLRLLGYLRQLQIDGLDRIESPDVPQQFVGGPFAVKPGQFVGTRVEQRRSPCQRLPDEYEQARFSSSDPEFGCHPTPLTIFGQNDALTL